VCPHTAYWKALVELKVRPSEFILRPSLKEGSKGILPQVMEQGCNMMIADQCREYFARYMIQQNVEKFSAGKTIYCRIKLCDMGSSNLNETTLSMEVRYNPENQHAVENKMAVMEKKYEGKLQEQSKNSHIRMVEAIEHQAIRIRKSDAERSEFELQALKNLQDKITIGQLIKLENIRCRKPGKTFFKGSSKRTIVLAYYDLARNHLRTLRFNDKTDIQAHAISRIDHDTGSHNFNVGWRSCNDDLLTIYNQNGDKITEIFFNHKKYGKNQRARSMYLLQELRKLPLFDLIKANGQDYPYRESSKKALQTAIEALKTKGAKGPIPAPLGYHMVKLCRNHKGGYPRGNRKWWFDDNYNQSGKALGQVTFQQLEELINSGIDSGRAIQVHNGRDWVPVATDGHLRELTGTTGMRRRMAQREFSNRRDSPVMTRLLEEIIAAQDK